MEALAAVWFSIVCGKTLSSSDFGGGKIKSTLRALGIAVFLIDMFICLRCHLWLCMFPPHNENSVWFSPIIQERKSSDFPCKHR